METYRITKQTVFWTMSILLLSTATAQIFTCPTGCSCKLQIVTCNSDYSGKELVDLGNRTDLVLSFFNCRFSVNLSSVSYTSAETLTFENCGIGPSIANRSLASLTSLQYLTISGNRHLTEVAVEAFFGLDKLEQLDLSGNDIVELPANLFVGLNSLQLVDLSGNSRLRSIPASIFGSSQFLSLTQLLCNECGLDDIPRDLIRIAPNLTRLDLNRNNLTTALAKKGDRPFNTLRRLTELSLDQSRLSTLASDVFAGLESGLRTLRLGHNDITRINETTLIGLVGLQRLELDNNKLTRLKEVVLPTALKSTNASQLYLGGNPWTCDGELLWLRKLGSNVSADSENVKCAEPDQLHGQQLFLLPEKSFKPTQDGACSSSPAAVAAVILSTFGLTALACAFLYRFCVSRKRRSSPARYANVDQQGSRSGGKL